MVIAVWNRKGGVGKTTIATNLASYYARRKRRVLLVDSDDRQAAATAFVDAARSRGLETLDVARGSERTHLELRKVAAAYDTIVIDCPGFETRAQKSALVAADLVVLPVGESVHDRVALAETAIELGDLQTRRFESGLRALPVLGVAMRVDLRRSIATRAREALIVVELSGLSVASTVLADRAEWVESAEFGESVADYAPRSTAAAEFKAFVRELERLAAAKGVQ